MQEDTAEDIAAAWERAEGRANQKRGAAMDLLEVLKDLEARVWEGLPGTPSEALEEAVRRHTVRVARAVRAHDLVALSAESREYAEKAAATVFPMPAPREWREEPDPHGAPVLYSYPNGFLRVRGDKPGEPLMLLCDYVPTLWPTADRVRLWNSLIDQPLKVGGDDD